MREFSDKNWKPLTLKDLLRKIDKTGDMQCYPGRGRLRTVHVPDNISMVQNLIQTQGNDDTHASLLEKEHMTGASGSSICHRAKNDIGLKGIQE